MVDVPLIYTADPEKIWNASRRFLTLLLSLYLVALAVFYAMNVWTGATDTAGFLGSFGAGFLVGSFYTFVGWKLRRSYWEGYALFLERQTLTCRQKNKADIVLYFREVSSIRVRPNGTMAVRGRDSGVFFIIPPGMDGYDRLKEALEQAFQIQPFPPLTSKPLGLGLAIAGYVSLFATIACVLAPGAMLWLGVPALVLNALYLVFLVRRWRLGVAGNAVGIWPAILSIAILFIFLYISKS